LVIAEIKLRFATAHVCAEVRLRAKQKADAAKFHKATIQELKQRYRHRELTKEIKTRQKQIFWKKNTCTIIKQGGFKIRVNNEIRAIARQRNLKKQINIIIRQGGFKSRVQKEIRQIRAIMELKKQKTLKAKVNKKIRQIARDHADKRRVDMVLKQTGLKAECNRKIECKEFYLKPLSNQRQMRSQSQIKKRYVNQRQTKTLSGIKSMICDEKDTVFGDTVANTGIRVLNLIECVDKARKLKEKQDGEIRMLATVVAQQKADFAALNMRLVEDKNRLYQKLEDLKQENEMLAELLRTREREELVMKALQKAHAKDMRRQNNSTQPQQAPQFYQEMQKLNKSTLTSNKTQAGQFLEPDRMAQIF